MNVCVCVGGVAASTARGGLRGRWQRSGGSSEQKGAVRGVRWRDAVGKGVRTPQGDNWGVLLRRKLDLDVRAWRAATPEVSCRLSLTQAASGCEVRGQRGLLFKLLIPLQPLKWAPISGLPPAQHWLQ